mgnify:CR=1 FL=1
MVRILSLRVPSEEHLALVKAKAQDIEPDYDHLRSWTRSYVLGHSKRIALDVDIVCRYATKDDAILECGSIPPLLTASLKDLGYCVTGVDIDPSRFSQFIQSRELNVVRCDLESEIFPFAEGQYDIIIFNEIFEHLRLNIIKTMKEVHRILKKDGILLLSTPNLRSVNGIMNFLFRNKSYSCCPDIYQEYAKLEQIGHMGHVREYTTREVSEFLAKLDFKVETLLFRGSENGQLARITSMFTPRFRPFVTYVARAQKSEPKED